MCRRRCGAASLYEAAFNDNRLMRHERVTICNQKFNRLGKGCGNRLINSSEFGHGKTHNGRIVETDKG